MSHETRLEFDHVLYYKYRYDLYNWIGNHHKYRVANLTSSVIDLNGRAPRMTVGSTRLYHCLEVIFSMTTL